MANETSPKIVEPTIFELSSPGRTGVTMPASDVPASPLPPKNLLRAVPSGDPRLANQPLEGVELLAAFHAPLAIGKNGAIEVAHLKRTADRLDRAASRVSLALIIAALIIGSSIVMTVGGGPTLLGLPAFGLLGFLGAVAGGLWLLRSIWRGGHPSDRDDDGA